MTFFIKLTSRLINKSHIIEIVQSPRQYNLFITNHNINGFWVMPFFGVLTTSGNNIKICETENKQDYDIITEFIKEIK
jgi:hypothetical protein